MGVKKTHELIPLCHPLSISHIDIKFNFHEKNNSIEILATCKSSGQTGIEMEALTAASVAALTIYDMCKSVDKSMTINFVTLLHKSGGRSGTYNKI